MKTALRNLALTSLLVSGVANAELNYSYVEGGLGVLSPSGQTYVGPDVRGSFAVTDDIFVYGGLRFLTDDTDYTNWHLGAGYRFAIDEQTDVWAGANLEYQEFKVKKECETIPFFGTQCWGGSIDDTAIAIRGGVRHQLNQDIEVGGTARLVTGDFDYFGINGHVRYKLMDNLSAKGELDIQDGDLGIFAGVTYFF